MIILAVLQYANNLLFRKFDSFDIIPTMFMFKYEQSSPMVNNIRHLRLGKTIIILHVIIFFAFLNTYNQSLRSSTIEPFFEDLPDDIRDVNAHESLVRVFGHMELTTGLRDEWYMPI